MKKIFGICLMLLLPCALILTACGASKKLTCTYDTLPLGVQAVEFSGSTSSDKGTTIKKGQDTQLNIRLEDNYEINTLKVLVNQQQVELNESETSGTTLYSYLIQAPQEDIHVSFVGVTKEIKSTVTIKYERSQDIDYDREILKNFNIEFDPVKVDLGTQQGLWTMYDFAEFIQSEKALSNVRVGTEYKFTISSNPIYKYKISTFVLSSMNTDPSASDFVYSSNVCENEKRVFTFMCDKSDLTIVFQERYFVLDDNFDISVNNTSADEKLGLSSFNNELLKFSANAQSNFIKTTDTERVLNIEMVKFNEEQYKPFYQNLKIKINEVAVDYEVVNENVIKIVLDKPYNYNENSSGNNMSAYSISIMNFYDKLEDDGLIGFIDLSAIQSKLQIEHFYNEKNIFLYAKDVDGKYSNAYLKSVPLELVVSLQNFYQPITQITINDIVLAVGDNHDGFGLAQIANAEFMYYYTLSLPQDIIISSFDVTIGEIV